MKIALCDDEVRCLSEVVAIAKEYVNARSEKNISIATFFDPEDLLESAEKLGGYDIYILDIVMPGMNGIELGKKLREAGEVGKIIYLTSSEEYALESFRVRAFNYIIKPIEKDVFFEALDEALASIEVKKDKIIVVKTRERSVKLTFDSIVYAELSKRAVVYHLVGGKSVETVSLRSNFSDSVSDLTADPRFVLCGAGLAVNLDHISGIEGEAVFFDAEHRTFLGKKACRELRAAWTQYLLGTEE